MRIITGKYKGRNLLSVDGNTTRPTTAYNREIIFSVYADYEDKRVLDLYAGTGSFGLEALSRGAEYVDFVEFASKAIGVLLQNIANFGCGDDCHVYRKRVQQYLQDCEQRYDVIFLDPPYEKNLVNPTLELILESAILKPEGIIIAEHSKYEPVSEEFSKYVTKTKVGKLTGFSLLSLS